eukprot:1224599-Rhodomonas_salina.1
MPLALTSSSTPPREMIFSLPAAPHAKLLPRVQKSSQIPSKCSWKSSEMLGSHKSRFVCNPRLRQQGRGSNGSV